MNLHGNDGASPTAMVFHPPDLLEWPPFSRCRRFTTWRSENKITEPNPSHYHSKCSYPYESFLFLRNLHQPSARGFKPVAAPPCNFAQQHSQVPHSTTYCREEAQGQSPKHIQLMIRHTGNLTDNALCACSK